jgi:hypothetical protein
MSGVFQNIDPLPPHRPASVYLPPFGAGGGHIRWAERGVNILEDADSALYSTYVSTLWNGISNHCGSLMGRYRKIISRSCVSKPLPKPKDQER